LDGGSCRAATTSARAAATWARRIFKALEIRCVAFARRYSSQRDEFHRTAAALSNLPL